MRRAVIIGLIVVALVVVGIVLFRRKALARQSGPVAAPRPSATQSRPLATSGFPAPAPRPSLVSTGLNIYQAGCTALSGPLRIPSTLANSGCNPKFNPVLQANLIAGKTIVSGAKTIGSAIGSLF